MKVFQKPTRDEGRTPDWKLRPPGLLCGYRDAIWAHFWRQLIMEGQGSARRDKTLPYAARSWERELGTILWFIGDFRFCYQTKPWMYRRSGCDICLPADS